MDDKGEERKTNDDPREGKRKDHRTEASSANAGSKRDE